MITIQHQSTRYTVTPENAVRIRATLDKGSPKHKFIGHTPAKYFYPVFTPGMTTSEYVRIFRENNGHRVPLEHECANYYSPAAMLDPSTPAVIEETNPDYIAPVTPAKVKKQSIKEQLHALQKVVTACLPDLQHYAATHGPGPDTRLAALLEVLKNEG